MVSSISRLTDNFAGELNKNKCKVNGSLIFKYVDWK